MSDKHEKTDFPSETFKSDAVRQRWELFHRAIAYAKESNDAALHDADAVNGEAESAGPCLTIVR